MEEWVTLFCYNCPFPPPLTHKPLPVKYHHHAPEMYPVQRNTTHQTYEQTIQCRLPYIETQGTKSK